MINLFAAFVAGEPAADTETTPTEVNPQITDEVKTKEITYSEHLYAYGFPCFWV